RPHSTPVRTGGGQWATQPPRPVRNLAPAQPPRPSPVRSFTPAGTQPPRANPPQWANAPARPPRQAPQHIPQHIQMPAAHVRATPAPVQHFARPFASSQPGNSSFGHSRGGGNGRGGGGGGHR